MPPPKKAAKKAAKKATGHHDPHKAAKDARRTFEHLGRVQAIAKLTNSESETLAFLSQTADRAFRAGQYKDSADLLRAAEHLSFASLYREATETVADNLKATIKDEFDHLLERAEDHANHHSAPKEVHALMERMTKEAKAALKRGSYRAALEFARGAEALAHVDELKPAELSAGKEQKRLQD
ncbi:hypothetical protein [Silvibacterium acidisoli]|uniref:hypothetical protein n=1 Tax=Acidobacteriaceae bacterium ZG23-2 TaxID=2883246 RepID=UPI00406D29CB